MHYSSSRPIIIDPCFAPLLGIKQGSILWNDDEIGPTTTISIIISSVLRYARNHNILCKFNKITLNNELRSYLTSSDDEVIPDKISTLTLEKICSRSVLKKYYPREQRENPQRMKLLNTLSNVLEKINILEKQEIILKFGLKMIKKEFSSIANSIKPSRIGYYTKEFQRMTITLLCIHRFRMNYIPKDIFMLIINTLAKDPNFINLNKFKILNTTEFDDCASITNCQTVVDNNKIKQQECEEVISKISSGEIVDDDFPNLNETRKSKDNLKLYYLDESYADLFDMKKGSVLWPHHSVPVITLYSFKKNISIFYKRNPDAFKNLHRSMTGVTIDDDKKMFKTLCNILIVGLMRRRVQVISSEIYNFIEATEYE